MENKKWTLIKILFVSTLALFSSQCEEVGEETITTEDTHEQSGSFSQGQGSSSNNSNSSIISVNVEEESLNLTSESIGFQATLHCNSKDHILNQGNNKIDTQSEACCIILNSLSVGDDLVDDDPSIGSPINLAASTRYPEWACGSGVVYVKNDSGDWVYSGDTGSYHSTTLRCDSDNDGEKPNSDALEKLGLSADYDISCGMDNEGQNGCRKIALQEFLYGYTTSPEGGVTITTSSGPSRYIKIDKDFSRPNDLTICNSSKDNKVASQAGDAYDFTFSFVDPKAVGDSADQQESVLKTKERDIDYKVSGHNLVKLRLIALKMLENSDDGTLNKLDVLFEGDKLPQDVSFVSISLFFK